VYSVYSESIEFVIAFYKNYSVHITLTLDDKKGQLLTSPDFSVDLSCLGLVFYNSFGKPYRHGKLTYLFLSHYAIIKHLFLIKNQEIYSVRLLLQCIDVSKCLLAKHLSKLLFTVTSMK
jgi:hypothetical protein